MAVCFYGDKLYLTSDASSLNNAALMVNLRTVFKRVLATIWTAVLAGIRSTLLLARIMVPVSLVISLLDWIGMLTRIADWLAPVMGFLGLPGEAVLVLAGSVLFNVYGALAAIDSLPLGARETIILAVMSLAAHNLVVESAVMKKTGSSAVKMILLRFGWALALGWLLNCLLPASEAGTVPLAGTRAGTEFPVMLGGWGLAVYALMVRMLVLICGITVVQRLFDEFCVGALVTRLLSPLMRVFGLGEDLGFIWMVSNLSGYSYSATLILDRVKNGKLKPREADLFNHHASLSHSLFEDTALYMAIGVPPFWLTLPRVLAAAFVVWVERIRQHLFRRSFRVGTA